MKTAKIFKFGLYGEILLGHRYDSILKVWGPRINPVWSNRAQKGSIFDSDLWLCRAATPQWPHRPKPCWFLWTAWRIMKTLAVAFRSEHSEKTFSITVFGWKVMKFHIAELLQVRIRPTETSRTPLQSSFSESWDFGQEHIEKLEIRFSIFWRKALKRPELKNCLVMARLSSTGCFVPSKCLNRPDRVFFWILEVLRFEWWVVRCKQIISARATSFFVCWGWVPKRETPKSGRSRPCLTFRSRSRHQNFSRGSSLQDRLLGPLRCQP